MDEVFAPDGLAWQRVSPKLALLRRIRLTTAVLVVAAACAVGLGELAGPVAALSSAGAVLLLGVWGWWLVGRSAARWRYAERDEDLYIGHGALVRRLVVVPYGRMQYADVQSGPLEQLAGIATLQLHTASPSTRARIPGLPAAEAARLRDRLTAMGDALGAGL